MPRPRRTKVASQGVRGVTTSEDIPTSTASKPSKAGSMAPLNRSRGGAARFGSSKEVEEIESSGQKAPKKLAKKGKGKPAKKKVIPIPDDDDDELEEEQTGALNALKARMGTGKVGESTSSGSAAASRKSPLDKRRRTSPSAPAQVRTGVSLTTKARQSSAARGRTPSVQPNTDDDLYGLSPAGKASQARLGGRRSSVPRAPLSALKVQGTPGMETSILALANFKRRPRQPSMIRMVQQSSELGREEEDVYLGVDLELDQTLRDFDDFVPEDESTPLNFGKKKQDVAPSAQPHSALTDEAHTSSSRKRKRGEPEEEIQIPGSYGSSPPHIEGTTWARSTRSSSLPEEPMVASTEEPDPIYAEPVSQSDTMAAPRSSSEPASPKRQKTRGKILVDKFANTKKQHAKKPPKVSTAHLQSLLPKLRAKPSAKSTRLAATYDVPSDSELENTFDLPEDGDELSRPVGRRRAPPVRPTKTPLAKKDTNKKLGKRTPAPSAAMKAKQKRTYGRQSTAEKENDESAVIRSDEEDEDTIEIGGDEKTARTKAGKSKELEKARKMFAAVDEWEMEFESVDLGGGESSPWR